MKPAYVHGTTQWFDIDQATKWIYRYSDGSACETMYRTRKGGYFRSTVLSLGRLKGKDDQHVYDAEPVSKEKALRWFMLVGSDLPADLVSTQEEQEV